MPRLDLTHAQVSALLTAALAHAEEHDGRSDPQAASEAGERRALAGAIGKLAAARTDEERACKAQCEEPPGYWHTHTCPRRSATDRHGVPLCAQHARMADRKPHLLATWAKGPR